MTINENLRDQIKTYEDACALKGIQPLTLAAFTALPESQQQAAFSRHKIEIIVEVLKQGREFDWSDYDQRKYYPWFDMETYNDGRANDGFVLSRVLNAYVLTAVGSRLCYFSREDAQYVATQFLEDYKAFMK